MKLKQIKHNKDYSVITELLASYIYTRDNSTCQITGGKGTEIHHIVFKSHGGTNKPDNLVLLSSKGHRLQHGLTGEEPVPQDKLISIVQKNEKRLRRRL